MFVHTRGARRIVSTTPLRWLHRQQRPLRRLLQPSIRTKTSQSKPPPNHKSTSGSSWKTAALGTSGFVLFCGLDFVAPAIISILTDEDPEKEITYWKERNRLSSSTTDSSNKKKSSFQLSRTQNNAATEIKERSQLLSLKKDTVNGGSSNNNNNNIQANVVIVGGGLAGLHTALALSERSPQPIHILLLDAHRIGQGASGKSKGLVVPGIQVPEEDLAESCGSQVLAAKIYKLSYQAMKRLKTDIVQKYKISCDWVDSGLVEATLWVEEEEAGDKDADATEDDDDGCRALSATEVRQMLGQPKTNNLYQGGEFDPSCSGVDPLALTCGIANVLETKFGVQLYEQTKATKVEKYAPKDNHVDTTKSQEQETKVGLNNKYLVTTDTGAQIECQHVVLCTGPALVSKELSKRIANAIIPIYTWMASTPPLGDACPLKDDNKQPAPMAGDDYVSLNYWRRTEDGRILFGSLADAYPIPNWLAEYRLRRALREVYPQLGDIPFDHVWGGTLAFASNAVPLIGRDEGFDYYDSNKSSDYGVWYATGFGGHGIVPTVMAGSVLADAILGIDDKTWRIFQQEFPPQYAFWPFGRIGGETILSVYNLFDWLHVKGFPIPRFSKPW